MACFFDAFSVLFKAEIEMKNLIEKAEMTHCLSKEEIVLILDDNVFCDDLFAAADRVRHSFVGDEVHLRGLIEFSNICKNRS